MSSKAQRRVVFIDKKFQTSFILKFIGLLVVGTIIFNIATYFILNRRLEDTLYSAHLTLKSVGEILLPSLVSLSLIFVVLLGLAILIMTLFVSHLIAGPLYAMKRYLDLISEGNMDFQARLRGKDQTMPLAVSLARAVEVLNEHISTMQSTSLEITEASRKLKEGLKRESGGVSDETSRNAEQLARLGSKISEEAGFFKTRSVDKRS